MKPMIVGIILGISYFLVPTFLTGEVLSAEYSKWIADSPLPFPVSGNQVLTIEDKLYNFGGGDDMVFHTEILSSKINESGELDNWSASGSMPMATTWFSIVKGGLNIYLLGGAVPSPNTASVVSVSSVFFTKIKDDGSITDWTQAYSLPSALSRGASLIYNKRIYYIGGLRHSLNGVESVVSTVYKADILDDGNIGNWSSTNSLPSPKAEFSTFVYGNHIYAIAGMESNTSPSNSMYIGEVDESSGDINWTIGASIPKGLRRPAYTNVGNQIYLIGGYDGSNFTKDIYVGEFNKDTNTIDSWKLIDIHLENGECCSAASSYLNHIYLVGGHDGIKYYPDVYRSEIHGQTITDSFPDMKQYDPAWALTEYDNAKVWSNGKTEISRWGCALTSAAMILSYYGHSINPNDLNRWLLANNGYIGDGFLNWSAVTKYSKLSHDMNNLLPTLEYRRYEDFDNEVLDKEIEASRPAILKLERKTDRGTHFVVINGKDNGGYRMVDPSSPEKSLSYYSSFDRKTIGTFLPSNTDLSYLYLYINPNIKIEVIDPDGRRIKKGFEENYELIDQTNGMISSQSKLKSLVYPKPKNGKYFISLSGQGGYTLDARIYDVEGNLVKDSFEGKISKGKTVMYVISNEGKASTFNKLDFNYLRNEIRIEFEIKHTISPTIYKFLLTLIKESEKAYLHGNNLITKKNLKEILTKLSILNRSTKDNYNKEDRRYLEYLIESI